MSGKYKRKLINFSIKRHMQLRLFVKVLGVALVGIALMATIFYFYSNREIGGSYKQFHIHAKNFLDYLFPAVNLSILAAILFAVLITLFFPLRIAGPLFRIEREIKEKIGEGDFAIRFKLRPGDEVSDLAEALNYCLEKLSKRIARIKELSEKLESGAQVDNNRISEHVKELNEELKWFRLKDK